MSNLKFRYVAKYIGDPIDTTVSSTQTGEIRTNIYTLSDTEQGTLHIHHMSDQWDRLAVEQFTGLHDKNGKEIYVGDIVEYRNIYRDGHPILRKIVKDMFHAAFLARQWTPESEVEVIGNIHENPELLGQKR